MDSEDDSEDTNPFQYGKYGPDAHIPLPLRYYDQTDPTPSTLNLLWDVWQLDQSKEHHLSARNRAMDRHFGHDPHTTGGHPYSDSSVYSKNCLLASAWRSQAYRHHLVWTCMNLQQYLGEQILPKRPKDLNGGPEEGILAAVEHANAVKEQGNHYARKGDHRKALLRYLKALTSLIPFNTDSSTMTQYELLLSHISECEFAIIWNICRAVVAAGKSKKPFRTNVVETIYAYGITFTHAPYPTWEQYKKTVQLTEQVNIVYGLDWGSRDPFEMKDAPPNQINEADAEAAAAREDGRCCDSALLAVDGLDDVEESEDSDGSRSDRSNKEEKG